MLMPPRKAVRPSTISSLRWSRWFSSQSLRATRGFIGLNSSTRMPLSARRWKKAAGVPSGADAVADQVDLHALALLVDQGLRKALADLVVVEDVGLHVDVVAGRHDGRQHRPVGGRAVLQQPHPVAGGQRAADDGLLARQVAVEDAGLRAEAAQAFEHGLALRGRQGAARPFQLHGRPPGVAPGRARAPAAGCRRPGRAGRSRPAAATPTSRRA